MVGLVGPCNANQQGLFQGRPPRSVRGETTWIYNDGPEKTFHHN